LSYFVSETDTEVIPHAIAEFLTQLEKQGNVILKNRLQFYLKRCGLTVEKFSAGAIAVFMPIIL
jgi:glucosamine 6-phosphate synthetase-like amidotransferase/phosphosugar isomerase protein